jgi:TRAP-type C4-dicarboxylate transport system substrate-binding protein
MKRNTSFVLIAAMAILLLLITVSAGLAKPLKLKAVGFLPTNHALATMTVEWVDRVNEQLRNQINISLGGPETIPGMQQPDAVKSGVVDIIFNSTAYATSLFPEGWAFFSSKYTPTEEREPGGFYDFMDGRFQKINMKYLGRWLWSPFYLWTKNEVNRLDDLGGLKMRTASHFDRFMKEMGVIPVTVMTGDTYTALERGTVEGFGWPLMGPREMGWTDSCKYIIDHPFHEAQNCVILMNLDTWKRLPQEAQEKIMKITINLEPEMVAYFKKKNDEEWSELDKVGVKRVKFPPSDAEKYLEIIHRVDWEILNEKVPALVPELKRVTGFE